MPERSFDVAVLGAGFGGSILARCLAAQGSRVLLLERGAHPRFALGESSTPLAALSLDRLAERYGLADLPALGAWGRWRAEQPELGCGLKRGFTFYRHTPGEAFTAGPDNARRLLVAASPRDEIADVHWLRRDVDAALVERAAAEGVRYVERTEILRIETTSRGFRLECAGGGEYDSRGLVDASGRSGLLTDGAGDALPLATRSGLTYGHLRAARSLRRTVDGELPGRAPYPDERAAVHHLLDEGWAYDLRFDDGLVSFGFLERGGLSGDADPAARWEGFLRRYPTLRAMLENAEAVEGPRALPLLQYRRARAAGPGWAALPHAYAFVDPLYSTGIAWTLRCVERLAGLFGSAGAADTEGLAAYADLVSHETDRIDGLVAGAYRAMQRFGVFTAWSMLYFTEASYAEARERLRPTDDDPWRGFLGAGVGERERVLADARHDLAATLAHGDDEGFARRMAERCAPRDVAGLCDPERRNLHPVDLGRLVDGAAELGLTEDEVRAGLHRLRGAGRL